MCLVLSLVSLLADMTTQSQQTATKGILFFTELVQRLQHLLEMPYSLMLVSNLDELQVVSPVKFILTTHTPL